MKTVGIADLKARLSEYIRLVRRGEIVAVLDRGRAVAQIVPMRGGLELRIREPVPGTPLPGRVPLPGPLKLSVDVVDVLFEERQGHR